MRARPSLTNGVVTDYQENIGEMARARGMQSDFNVEKRHCHATSALERGKRTTKHAPVPGGLETVMLPPYRVTIR